MKKQSIPKQHCTHCGTSFAPASTFSICPKCRELKRKYKELYSDYDEHKKKVKLWDKIRLLFNI